MCYTLDGDGFHSRVVATSLLSLTIGVNTGGPLNASAAVKAVFLYPPKMSKLLESLVWQSDLKAELKPLAAVVADMGNDDGLGIYPSVAYLAWLLGRSERSIQTSLRALDNAGVLRRLSNHAGGRHQVPQYKFHSENLPKRTPWKETRKGAITSPFPEKGEVNDMKRVQSSTERVKFAAQKGAKSAPDPLVEPLEDPLEEEERRGFPFDHFAVIEYSGTLNPEPPLAVYQAEVIASTVHDTELERALWSKVLMMFKGNGYRPRLAGNAVDRFQNELRAIKEGKKDPPLPPKKQLTIKQQMEAGLL